MNGNVKWHKANGPAFAPGEQWESIAEKHRCTIVSVRKFGEGKWDYEVTYRAAHGTEYTKDAWNFQVRYMHIADHQV